MNSARSLSLLLCAALVGGLIPPQAARAAAPVLIELGGQGGITSHSAAAGAGAIPVLSASSVAGASLLPTASFGVLPVLAAPSISATPSAAPAFAAPASAGVSAAAAPALIASPSAAASVPSDETPAAPKAAAPAGPRLWLSRAAGLFSRRAAPASPEAAPASAADAKAQADALFDGGASAPSVDETPVAPQGRLSRAASGLRRFAVRRLEAYKAKRAIGHDDFGGPKSDGPMSFGAKARYGFKWGLNLVGISALLDFTVAPLLAHVPWPLMLSAGALGEVGRVELLTKYGPNEIGAALTHAPLSFLGIALPMSTGMEEFTYRFLSFGLTFGLLAAAKPAAKFAAGVLGQIPDAAGFRSTVQRVLLAAGGLVTFFAFPFAALKSSFGFAVAHFAHWGVDPSVFALNLVAGYFLARAAYKTRGLTAPFVAHLVFNLVMLGSAVLGTTFGLPLAASVYSVIASVVGLGALWYNWRSARKERAMSLKGLGAGAKNFMIAALIVGTVAGGVIRHAAVPQSTSAAALFQAKVPAAAPAAPEQPVAAPKAEAAPADASSGFKTAADMVAAVKPSVVEIVVRMDGGYAIGSGVIVSPSGLLVTNGHVVGDKKIGEIVEVKLSNDQKVPGKIMAVNHNRDLAFIQLPRVKNPGGWPFSRFAGTAPREGDVLYAMGHPLGLPFTVSKGILSGLGDRDNMFVQYLQTDASINHGNSGGPIYNERGEIVGINTMIMGKDGSIGVGFSIIAPSVVHALQQYAATGNIATAALGVVVDLSNPTLPEMGVAVESVRPGSAAAKAGLLGGDLIVGIGGELIPDGGRKAIHDLATILAEAKPGDVIELAVMRGDSDKPLMVKLTLDARSTSEETSMAHGFDGEGADDADGGDEAP
jgi:S1-C subfamily serine protease